MWKLWLNTYKTETISFSKCCSPLPDPIQIQDTFVPWAPTTHYLGLRLRSKLLFSQCLHTVANKATGIFCNIFPLLTQDSALTQSNKVSIYKLLIRSILTYTTHVWSSTCSSNYLRLQIIQSKCLQVIGNHPRHTPTAHLHNTLNIEPVCDFVHLITARFCPSHPNPQSNK